MKVILRSTDLSLIESAQIALDAHDIPSLLTDQNMTGLPASASSLVLVDDSDFERAAAVLGELKRTTPQPRWEGSRTSRSLLWLAVLLVFVFLGWCLF